MEPYTRNGSFVGRTADFGDSSLYFPGSTTYSDLTFVGGYSVGFAGTTSTVTITLTSLSGGIGTSPQPGDWIIISYNIGFGSGQTAPNPSITSFVTLASAVANDTYTTFLRSAYRVAPSPAPTSISLSGGTGDIARAGTVTVHVWRNVSNITGVTFLGAPDTGIPNPPPVTTTLPKSQIILAGANNSNIGNNFFTASYLSNFRTAYAADNFNARIGMGSFYMDNPGTYDGAPWGWSSDSTAYSTAMIGFVLNPIVTVIPPSNAKNSGIWDLHTVYDYKASLIT